MLPYAQDFTRHLGPPGGIRASIRRTQRQAYPLEASVPPGEAFAPALSLA